jgi:acylphosphatase
MSQPPGGPHVRLRAIVHGYVQGVGYRYFARREAAARGLSGSARNLPDGTVEVVAEGQRPALEAFVQALWHGPSAAEVERVECEWGAADGTSSGFGVRY